MPAIPPPPIRRRRGPELSVQTRSRISELHTQGYGAKAIHSLHRDWSINTIKSTIRLEKIRKDNATRVRSGAPRKLTEEQRDYIYDITTHINPHATTRDLLEEVDYTVKETTMRKLLNEMGKRRWLQKKRPMITTEHAEKRMLWAIEH